ncbi:GTP-binding protein [Pseudomonas sp. dw_358]|uniref:CobW family GTP-binding protein n=1 Tax=Pseudomonas sp. dw_358 TaxID=2720083 RepID=UPI001BD42EEB|nr:GTP-binding protein [Pseudomonas sp. dw_358]
MSRPLNVITGFLGSGKTTLLQRLLAGQDLADTVVLINEFGEIGLDHLLVQTLAPDVVLLPSGCVCCSVRGDLKAALLLLDERRRRGEIADFARVLLETTGLADPAPILATLATDAHLRGHYHLGLIITVVDAEHAALQEQLHPEWLAQVAAADRLLLSKDDRVPATRLQALRERLGQLNAGAPQWLARTVEGGDELLWGQGLGGPAIAEEVGRWQLFKPVDNVRHSQAQVCCLSFDTPLDWVTFGVWLSMLLRCHGARILRVKGLLDVINSEQPVVIHGVQHCLHAPLHLAAWPNGERGSRLVFIVRDLDTALLRRSFHAFLGQTERAA